MEVEKGPWTELPYLHRSVLPSCLAMSGKLRSISKDTLDEAVTFDENNDDWACDEITDFSTRGNPFSWQEDTTWEEVLPIVKRLIQGYLESGNHSDKLGNLSGIACGFVDGDLELIYRKR